MQQRYNFRLLPERYGIIDKSHNIKQFTEIVKHLKRGFSKLKFKKRGFHCCLLKKKDEEDSTFVIMANHPKSLWSNPVKLNIKVSYISE